MRPAQKSQLKRVGIIAGTGRPPELLAEMLESRDITPYIIALDGITEEPLFRNRAHLKTPIGMAGAMFAWLRNNDVQDLVMSGALKRPDWGKLKVDKRGVSILAKILLRKTMGDDALLRTLRRELESEGFALHGIQEFVPQLLAPSGIMGKIAPLPEDRSTIALGFKMAKQLGLKDKGQAVAVQQDKVLHQEDTDGTTALLQKSGADRQAGRGPVLVKICKPQQDRALDMPTIGIQTVETAHACGFVGIVVEAGETLIVDREKVVSLCDDYGMFLLGFSDNA